MSESEQDISKDKGIFIENILHGIRMAGAFLIANSALIAAGIADTNLGLAWLALVTGAVAILAGSWTPAVARLRKEVKAAKGQTSCVKLPNGIDKENN